MAASFAADDQTDADFFDNLVDDDDAPAPAPVPAEHQPAEAALATAVSGLSIADDDADPFAEEEEAPPAAAAEAPPPEGGSPGSGKGGVHTAVKQVQWASFGGGGGDDGVDPFGDLSGGAGEEGFLGSVAGSQSLESSVFGSVAGSQSLESSVFGSVGAATDHGIFGGGGGSQSLAAEATDQDFFGGSSDQIANAQQQPQQQLESSGSVDSADPKYLESIYPGWKYDEATQQWYQVDSSDTSGNAATQVDNVSENVQQLQQQQLENSGSGSVDSTDPKYLESIYPGWKYDEATQQWYQVDNSDTSGNAATQADNISENVQQQQQQEQQFGVSYMQNSAQSALETIAEEGAAAGSSSTWVQGGTPEYPPNMLFYAEYPGWYFDTNSQQWESLETYKQAVAASAVQDGANHGVAASSSGSGTKQIEDITAHNQVDQHNSLTNSYSHQSQWQTGAFNNTMQPENVADNMAGSFYVSDQHANEESFSTSTNHQVGFSKAETATSHYGNENLESSSHQGGYSTIGGQQTSHKGFEPFTGHQAGYKGFEPSTGQQATQKMFEPSTGNQGGYKQFEPSTDHNQGGYKGFEPSTNHQGVYKGFEPSTHHQGGYTAFDPSTVNQAGYKGFEASTGTGHQTSFKGFEPSSGQHAGYIGSRPSTGYQASYMGFETSSNQGYSDVNGVVNTQGFVPMESMYESQIQAHASAQVHLSNSYPVTENSTNFSQSQFLGANASHLQYGHSRHEDRSSAGRPPHALVAFGFGGKLIIMKESSSMATDFNAGNQANSSGTLSVLNILEVTDNTDASSVTNGNALSYFHALCRQPVPGPLVGGNAASKDVNKWLDEMVSWYESTREFQGGDPRKLLISLLKILCQHYGKLRSPFGSDPSQEDTDGPEMAVTKLFSSCKKSSNLMENFGSSVRCMKNIPSETQMQAVAQQVQNLLVSGRRKEALQCAQEGQLWGPAIMLALQLGDKFYVDTVKKMAQSHFLSGSPLRTLCLLIAGQPADVFNADNNINNYGMPSASQQPMEPSPNGMLDEWEENLAMITANKTKGDDLVITHLGDCLWKEKNEVAAAHSCYLVAELNIDPYSESARLCLIGADHLKCPRTFASPEAIQRTEVYEYAKVLGNSQYILLPFQPYKLIYAYMLAEVGRIVDSLRYCQASLKVLKASGRAPELEAWKLSFSSLEDRIRTHQQGGYGTNLAPAKLVGKIFTSLDKSISRMMGTPSASLPPLPHGSVNDKDSYSAPAAATKFVNSQSVMAMSSLMPSASVQSMSEMAQNSGVSGRKIAHNRSVSEPDFGRTPKQGAGSDSTQSNASGSGSSRFGWLGSTLQKTMGLVSKSHRQAKLGQQNKFYYNEKLKRWMEEGAEIPAEEPPLPPPPTIPSFQNGAVDYNLNGPMSATHTPNGVMERKSSNSAEHGLGMPPIPPGQNQFSARGRTGVRSRYVDTFNKAGAAGAMPSYNKPAAASVTPPSGAKFFVPTAAAVAAEQIPYQTGETHSEAFHRDERSSSPPAETSFSSPPPSTQFSAAMPSTIQRYPSMDNISTPNQGSAMSSGISSGSFSKSRASSWSGTYPEQFSAVAGARSPDMQNMPSPLMPGRPSHSRSHSNSSMQFNNLAEDLHEVEL